MNRSNPIPIRLKDKFRAWMRRHDHDDLPDPARLATLVIAADTFISRHRLRAAGECAASQYVRMVAAK
ncbi:hypothetical protein [uncultured Aquabacterium sp.]|uniref:hypothetical protein n=1 Tax=uncultured Aquabacterium sp. TaxID=158753 RepID=UPI0025F66718|nr:hypothetical protein [uncultured Aquabacterium sp.]